MVVPLNDNHYGEISAHCSDITPQNKSTIWKPTTDVVVVVVTAISQSGSQSVNQSVNEVTK